MLHLRKSMGMYVESKRGDGLPGTKNQKIVPECPAFPSLAYYIRSGLCKLAQQQEPAETLEALVGDYRGPIHRRPSVLLDAKPRAYMMTIFLHFLVIIYALGLASNWGHRAAAR